MSNPYRKDVRYLEELDLYVLADLYDVKSHAVFHAIKKLICAGKRGAKDYEQDLMEAIDAIERELQMVGLEEVKQPESKASNAIGEALILKPCRDPEWEGIHPDLKFAVRGENGRFVYGKDAPSRGEFWARPVEEKFDEQRMDAIGQNGNGGEHYELAVDLSRVTPHGFGCVTEINLNWRDAVDWSAASPHHKYAFQDNNGRIAFSMHLPGWPNEYIQRPSA